MNHLAQINIARLRHPAGDPRVAGFVDNVRRVNAMAERMPGFIWRFQDQCDEDLAARYFDDRRMTFTISVWESLAALENFVWNTIHKRFFDKRHDWFEPLDRRTMALWPVEVGHRPTVEEGIERLLHLERSGNSAFAFDWTFSASEPLSDLRQYG